MAKLSASNRGVPLRGQPGDFFYDTFKLEMFVADQDGMFRSLKDLQKIGAPGPIGPRGLTGAQGIQGPPGDVQHVGDAEIYAALEVLKKQRAQYIAALYLGFEDATRLSDPLLRTLATSILHKVKLDGGI